MKRLAAVGVVALAGCGGSAHPHRAAAKRTAPVERRDLVARVTIDGELGYANEENTLSALKGTVTWRAPEGSTVKPGEVLARIDDEPVLLLDGPRSAWRALAPGTYGRDVRDLERNLRSIGCDPDHLMTVNKTWTYWTTRAVECLQKRVGLTQTGTLELGRVVFLRGDRRVSDHPAQALIQTTATRRTVAASLSTDDQGAARAGDRVRVDLPGGRSTRGRISRVGAVAQVSDQDGTATVDVTITLPAKGVPKLDKAPVSVSLARERLRDAVAVPVTALLARQNGGYGVEVGTKVVPVTPGLFADGWVQVDGVRPGQRVAVPE